MAVFTLGVRNVYRNRARASLVVLILGLSVGLFVTLQRASSGTAAQARDLKARAGTSIEVNVRGSTGYVGTVDPRELSADVSAIQRLPHVLKVERYIRRQFVNNRRDLVTGVLIGVDPGATLRLQSMGGFIGNPRIIAGRNLLPEDSGKTVAVVGAAFAKSEGLKVGDTFTLAASELRRGKWIYRHSIKDLKAQIVGIFSVRVRYGDNQVFVPLEVARNVLLNGDKTKVGQYFVVVDSAENVPQVAAGLRKVLGERADVISQDAQAVQAAGALDALSRQSRWGAAVSAAVGALVVFFTMILVTRERTREIGTLKAIGGSNRDVGTLFSAETLALVFWGWLLGLVFYGLAGALLAKLVLGSLGASGADTLSFRLAWREVARSLGLALLFGVVGSLYPIWRAVRMNPAEAMRPR